MHYIHSLRIHGNRIIEKNREATISELSIFCARAIWSVIRRKRTVPSPSAMIFAVVSGLARGRPNRRLSSPKSIRNTRRVVDRAHKRSQERVILSQLCYNSLLEDHYLSRHKNNPDFQLYPSLGPLSVSFHRTAPLLHSPCYTPCCTASSRRLLAVPRCHRIGRRSGTS